MTDIQPCKINVATVGQVDDTLSHRCIGQKESGNTCVFFKVNWRSDTNLTTLISVRQSMI